MLDEREFFGSQGFTITELLLAAVFSLIVMGTLYGFYRDQLFQLLYQQTKTATLEDARGALDIMARDLRNAGAWASGTAPDESNPAVDDPNTDADTVCNRVYAATSTLIIVQMELDSDGNCTDTGETIKYELTGPTGTCPGSNIIRRNNVCLVANVVTPTGSLSLFTYYPAGTDPPPFCFSTGNPAGCSEDLAANLDDIKRVKITFAVQAANPNPSTKGANPNISSTLSSSVEFRNE